MQKLIEWEDSSSVGVKEIDEQHKAIISIINELFDRMHDIKDKTALPETIARLKSYAESHFANEEKYFDLYDYEDKERHKNSHRAYERQIAKYEEDFKNSKDFLSFEILDFLENWWLNHIRTEDKKYGKCFNEHGLE